VKALRFVESHFTLSHITTLTGELSVKFPLANKRANLCYSMKKLTTVSVQEFIPFHDK